MRRVVVHDRVQAGPVAGVGVCAGDLLEEGGAPLCRCRGVLAAVTLPVATSSAANRGEVPCRMKSWVGRSTRCGRIPVRQRLSEGPGVRIRGRSHSVRWRSRPSISSIWARLSGPTAKAPTFSSACATDLKPGMGMARSLRPQIHARAPWASVRLSLRRISRTASSLDNDAGFGRP